MPHEQPRQMNWITTLWKIQLASLGRFGLVVSAPDLKLGDPGSSLVVAHETNA